MNFYHQQEANLNDSYHNIDLFSENDNYHQIGNAYLRYELKTEKDVAVAANRVLVNGDAIRLVNRALAYCFKEARLTKLEVVL